MSLNLFKSKETSDHNEYNLRIVLCSKAVEGYSCSETEIRLRFDCSVAALILGCVDFACMQELFIENIKTRKQFPLLPPCPKHKPALLAAVHRLFQMFQSWLLLPGSAAEKHWSRTDKKPLVKFLLRCIAFLCVLIEVSAAEFLKLSIFIPLHAPNLLLRALKEFCMVTDDDLDMTLVLMHWFWQEKRCFGLEQVL